MLFDNPGKVNTVETGKIKKKFLGIVSKLRLL